VKQLGILILILLLFWLILFSAVVVAEPATAAPTAGAAAGRPDAPAAVRLDGRDPPRVELDRLRTECGAWAGRTVRFTLQLEGTVPSWNPYLTRFGTASHVAWRAWSGGQLPWRREDYEDPAPRLFAARGSEPARAIAHAVRFERFEAVGVVRAVFLDEPWIEVLELEPLGESIGAGTVLHASRALRLIGDGQWDLARSELDRARVPDLPEHALAELDRLLRVVDEGRRAARDRRR